MDLEKSLSEIAENAIIHRDILLENEAVTISTLVKPFISALGYDISSPAEVFSEYSADFGDKSSAKVDIAIMHNGEPAILFECKKLADTLESASLAQLMKYFAATSVHFGILTNGIVYKFFSDLDDENRMDERPFLVVDLTKINDRSISELGRFTKQGFDVDGTVAAASVLKYTRGMKYILEKQLTEPDDGFVQWLVKQVFSGVLSAKQKERFTPLVERAFKEFIDERINQTLTKALGRDSDEDDAEVEEGTKGNEDDAKNDGIVTTRKEIEGYIIVREILRETVPSYRIVMKDKKGFCGIYFDGHSHKSICRLYFNNEQNLYLGIVEEDKNQTKHSIESPEGIHAYAEAIIATAQRYLEEDP